MLILLFFVIKFLSAQQIIPLEFTEQGHLIVEAKFNGVKGRFIFDTGAGVNLLTKDYSDKLNGGLIDLKQRYTGFRSTGERMDVDLYRLTSFELAGFKVNNPIATIIDVDLAGLDGLISLGLFLQQPFTIDYQKEQLVLEDLTISGAANKGTKIPLLVTKDRDIAYTIFAWVNINNQKDLCFLIDTGAGKNAFHMNKYYLPLLGEESGDPVQERKLQSDFNKELETSVFERKLNSIAIASARSIEVSEPKFLVIDKLIYDGTMSLNWIGDRVTVDMANKYMIVR
ncbi:retropepsin-like aspartic protease [Olivibacter sp. XZL3]|uniref:retropepsin-like aspartic protease n=1 Tax=Olivibacter sp. XZL3 TaxID=1735116 RepID=UPI001066BE8D|nr:retropepsin-like aspartic protease [Olivibacter sp. XZL3]